MSSRHFSDPWSVVFMNSAMQSSQAQTWDCSNKPRFATNGVVYSCPHENCNEAESQLESNGYSTTYHAYTCTTPHSKKSQNGPKNGPLHGKRRKSPNAVKVPQILRNLNISVTLRVTEIFKMHTISGTLTALCDFHRFSPETPKGPRAGPFLGPKDQQKWPHGMYIYHVLVNIWTF